jgi:hypothetical protein
VPRTHAPIDIRALLLGRQLTPSAVQDATGVPAAVVNELARGRRTATADEAAVLAPVLGVTASELTQPVTLPDKLVAAIERPLHRAAIRLRAVAAQVSEAVMRYWVGAAVVAMPARTTVAERDVDAWDALVSQYLDE